MAVAISLSICLGSCGNNGSEKSNTLETKQQEAGELVKTDTALFKTV